MNAEYVSVMLFVSKEVDFLKWKQTQYLKKGLHADQAA